MAMSVEQRREAARAIFAVAVQSVMPERLIPAAVTLEGEELRIGNECRTLRPGQKIYVFGSGKGAAGMARSLLEVLGERVAGGVIVTNRAGDAGLGPLEIMEGSHPVPDEKSVRAAERLTEGMSGLAGDDHFIYLLSGGSSALVEKPMNGITLAEMQETTRLLLRHGVPIQQVNAVRKHLSGVKGGRLGQLTEASGSVLVISDVIGDDLSVIGSGPFIPDPTTFRDCREILDRASIWDKLPASVRSAVEAGENGEVQETPKKEREGICHHLIGTNRVALEGARTEAEKHGLNTCILASALAGEAREAARVLVAIARNISLTGEPFSPPCCLLFGGETTVTVRGDGRGGRNQELALAALAEIGNDESLLLLSAGTDGIDGNSDAAGALADSALYREASSRGLRITGYLDANDANGFFARVGGLLQTGATGTNVMDIILIIIDKEEA
jgi:hydroxypyruvate reductase/glycerate 2-kinase